MLENFDILEQGVWVFRKPLRSCNHSTVITIAHSVALGPHRLLILPSIFHRTSLRCHSWPRWSSSPLFCRTCQCPCSAPLRRLFCTVPPGPLLMPIWPSRHQPRKTPSATVSRGGNVYVYSQHRRTLLRLNERMPLPSFRLPWSFLELQT